MDGGGEETGGGAVVARPVVPGAVDDGREVGVPPYPGAVVPSPVVEEGLVGGFDVLGTDVGEGDAGGGVGPVAGRGPRSAGRDRESE
ncbi:hypothetical protein B7767_24075, partial [Streptomyces sp. 13-12-16]|uniref:hypothetical protein n=2 Tax=unclassified Streptomyces TaxID=2593676 RepID=UPI000A25489A